MHIVLLPACLSVHRCICHVQGDQKIVLGPMKWKLQTVVNGHVGVGNKTLVFTEKQSVVFSTAEPSLRLQVSL